MMKHIDKDHIPTGRRPLGYWLAAIQGPLRETMRGAFAAFGVTRREWRTLTTLHAGPASAAEVEAALPAKRKHGRGHGHGHAGPGHGGRSYEHRTIQQLLDDLVTRGWASLDSGSYALTAEGERIHDAVLANVQKARANVIDGIPDADYATTMSTLERIATNVGWVPGKRPGHGRRRGHAPHGHGHA